MTMNNVQRPSDTGFLARTWDWMRDMDDAINYDPMEALHNRITRLEKQIKISQEIGITEIETARFQESIR